MIGFSRRRVFGGAVLLPLTVIGVLSARQQPSIGSEHAVARHLADGEESRLPLRDLLAHGRALFEANWSEADGAGRPGLDGTGRPLAEDEAPLAGARAFNRVSGPDANACRGCHNEPYGMAGGSGDFVTGGFETAERFAFVTFGRPLTGEVEPPRQSMGNFRSTPGLFGAGYVELLARQITRDLQRQRDTVGAGSSRALVSKGISFGTLARRADGAWDVSGVNGLPPQSLAAAANSKPSLAVHPWRQSGSVESLRRFTTAAFHRHMGMQADEVYGDADADRDGIARELTSADITAITLFQATLPVPGRVIPNDAAIESAVADGERLFAGIGCARCHVPALRLDHRGWAFREGRVTVDLTDLRLPLPRLVPAPRAQTLDVPLYSDLKLHDITDPAVVDAADPVDMNHPAGTPAFAAGNRRFLTARLWGAGNQPPYFHHGQFTTMRQAVLAHAGEALPERRAFEALAPGQRDAVIEFLKTLQVLPGGTVALVVDEHGRARAWPPAAMMR